MSTTVYSQVQPSRLRRREENENAQTSKRWQRGFEPGLFRLRVRHSTTELPLSTNTSAHEYNLDMRHCNTNKHVADNRPTGSYDSWIVRLVAIGPRCDRSAIYATIPQQRRISRSISTRGRAITDDWRISMARAIAGNRAASGSDQRPMYYQS